MSDAVEKKEPTYDEIVKSAKEYFEELKAKIKVSNDELLDQISTNSAQLFAQLERTGQIQAMKKLVAHIALIEKEHEIIKSGINTFVTTDEIKEFIDKVDGRVVNLIELHKYEREVPENVIQKYEKVKHLFTTFFVLFTDYTKEHAKKIAKERDPILFGMLQDAGTKATTQRMYVIGDWEDEYCDLTLDRLVSEAAGLFDRPIAIQFRDPLSLDEMRAKLKMLDGESKSDNSRWAMNNVVVTGTTASMQNIYVPVVPSEQDFKDKSIPDEVQEVAKDVVEEEETRSLLTKDSEIDTMILQETKKPWWKFW